MEKHILRSRCKMTLEKWIISLILLVTLGFFMPTSVIAYADDSAEYDSAGDDLLEGLIQADNLPENTDYVLVVDNSGSLWFSDKGVYQDIRNSATHAFLRVAEGTNNRIAVVYFADSVDESNVCDLSETNTEEGIEKLDEMLGRTVSPDTIRTKENASTNIAAGLEKAIKILDARGRNNKRCIILFSDGVNALYPINDPDQMNYIEKRNEEIFGKEAEGKKGLVQEIKDRKYELYCIYLENKESKAAEAKQEITGKEYLEKLVNACRLDGEDDGREKLFFVSGIPDASDNDIVKSKYLELAKQFSDVFYTSQNNSRHQELPMDRKEGSQISELYIPNAAVSQLNIFLSNVPEDSEPVLKNTDTNEQYTCERDANEKSMGYFNISHPKEGIYQITIPGGQDVEGAFAYYTDLRARITLYRDLGFDCFPIDWLSRVTVQCDLFDSQGEPYNAEELDNFELEMVKSVNEEDETPIPMRQTGASWLSEKGFWLMDQGSYSFVAKVGFKNDIINDLDYTMEFSTKRIDYNVLIMLVVVLAFIAFVIRMCRRAIMKIKVKNIDDYKKTMSEEKKTLEEIHEQFESNQVELKKNLNLYNKNYTTIVETNIEEFKEHIPDHLYAELGIVDLVKERKNYQEQYERAYSEYQSFYDDIVTKTAELNAIEAGEKESLNELTEKIRKLKNGVEQIRKSKSDFKEKEDKIKKITDEAAQDAERLEEADQSIGKRLFAKFECGLRILWPKTDERYRVNVEAKDFEYGIVLLDKLTAFPLSFEDNRCTFGEAVGQNTNIALYPYKSDNGEVGIELHSDKGFSIKDKNSNQVIFDPKDEKKDKAMEIHVAKLVRGGHYRFDPCTGRGQGVLDLLVTEA